MINIIIPAYNAHDTIKRAIKSVCFQDNVDDIQLTVVDDNSDMPYDLVINEFKHLVNINILKKSINEGCGQARQYGIDNTTSEYIMFLDADDCLFSFDSVKILYDTIKDNKADVVISDFIEELKNGQFIVHENSNIWMHGKIYRTEYIREKDIRFNYTRCNEDHVFNALLSSLKCKSIYVKAITYAWRYNKNSITNSLDYNYEGGFNDYYINANYCISEMQRLCVDNDIIKFNCATYLLNMYGYYNIFFANESIERKQLCINKTAQFMSKIPKDIVKELTIDYICQLLYSNDVIKEMMIKNMPFIITLEDFLSLITNGKSCFMA